MQPRQLQDINNLESLYIHGIDVKLSSLDFVQAFSSMQQLRTLSLYFGSAYSRAQQVPDLATHCPLLEHLTLYMFNANLVDLGDFVNLKSLHLIARRNLAIETSLYRSLTTKYANRLQLLEIKNVKIEHHQANYIVRLKALRALLCDRWPIVAWPLLSQLTELECLQLKEHVAGGNESASTDVLLNVIADLTKLRHLKLGKQWPIDDTLVSAVREVLCRRTGAKSGEEHIPFVLTLSSDLAPELENKLSVLRLGYFLRVDLSGSTTCQHCKLDGPDDVYPKQVLGITCWD
ncbi:uncharacterized protein LOC115623196 isoform X2 [Scaptodrosophila lebanonensis]|uniref:Uncharacterized protein LOC115623196 isoform X2 n=1 Tax=Drosophila lebanonensis TaxID=7225 RepID=A0A6J2TD15_DROLE|nr:uncharacterized protein LOC115623196 isoform X2 [Scaptodrosophila lebanonensis]